MPFRWPAATRNRRLARRSCYRPSVRRWRKSLRLPAHPTPGGWTRARQRPRCCRRPDFSLGGALRPSPGGPGVRRQRRSMKLLALILGLSLVAAACGGDDDDEGAEGDEAAEEESEGVQGGEFTDLGTFAQGPPE